MNFPKTEDSCRQRVEVKLNSINFYRFRELSNFNQNFADFILAGSTQEASVNNGALDLFSSSNQFRGTAIAIGENILQGAGTYSFSLDLISFQ